MSNLKRYEIGACCFCYDHTPWYTYEETNDGEWVKFDEAVEAHSNSLQQLKAKIADLEKSLSVVRGQSHGDKKVLEVIREELRQLSAV